MSHGKNPINNKGEMSPWLNGVASSNLIVSFFIRSIRPLHIIINVVLEECKS